MKVNSVRMTGQWRDVADAARTTVGKEDGTGEVSVSWRKRMLLAEHSPIRLIHFSWKWSRIKYWVSVHLVRHWLGIVHFVTTSRSDRTGIPRDKLPQDTPVDHRSDANVQALINISRRRLCFQASPETREAWLAVVNAVGEKDPVIKSVLVPDCIYRGGICREMVCCGWVHTEEAKKMMDEYNDTYKV